MITETFLSVLTESYYVGKEFTGVDKEYNDYIISFTLNITVYVTSLAIWLLRNTIAKFKYADLYDQVNDAYINTGSLSSNCSFFRLALPVMSRTPILSSAINIMYFKHAWFIYERNETRSHHKIESYICTRSSQKW